MAPRTLTHQAAHTGTGNPGCAVSPRQSPRPNPASQPPHRRRMRRPRTPAAPTTARRRTREHPEERTSTPAADDRLALALHAGKNIRSVADPWFMPIRRFRSAHTHLRCEMRKATSRSPTSVAPAQPNPRKTISTNRVTTRHSRRCDNPCARLTLRRVRHSHESRGSRVEPFRMFREFGQRQEGSKSA